MTPTEADALVDRLRAAFAHRAWGDTELVDLSAALRHLDHAGASAVIADAIATGVAPAPDTLGRAVAALATPAHGRGRAAAARTTLGPARGEREHWHGGPDPCPTCLPHAVDTSIMRGEVTAHLAAIGWTLDQCKTWRRQHVSAA